MTSKEHETSCLSAIKKIVMCDNTNKEALVMLADYHLKQIRAEANAEALREAADTLRHVLVCGTICGECAERIKKLLELEAITKEQS